LANCLIVLGVLFLLDNLHVLPFDWIFENGWPALLIGMGAWMLGNGLGGIHRRKRKDGEWNEMRVPTVFPARS